MMENSEKIKMDVKECPTKCEERLKIKNVGVCQPGKQNELWCDCKIPVRSVAKSNSL